MLDRYLLRYFLAIVDQGNFSRAAASCHVSQPTLSAGIAKLERILKQRVFVRSNQRIELTEAGSRLLAHARRIESEFNIVAQAMATSTSPTPFRLGVLASVPSHIIAGSVRSVLPATPARLEIIFGTERELIGHLAKGRIDVALTLVDRGATRFLERPIATEGYALVMARDHALAIGSEIAPELLAHEAMIVRRHCEALSETSRFFTERGIRPHFALRSTNDDCVLQMVCAGLGITVMPESFVNPGVVRPRLVGFNLKRTLGWAATHNAEHWLAQPHALMTAIEHGLRHTPS